MAYQLAIFDFDGTLADSFPFFTQVFNQLAEQHGFKGIDTELAHTFRHFSPKQVMEPVQMPAWKLPVVGKSFISLMTKHAASVPLFEGVDEMLLDLAGKGVTLAIVSSNSYQNVSQILGPENFKLFSHFECGMSIFGKSARIKSVVKKAGLQPFQAIYIGDQVPDLQAAHKENVAFGAVAWGYGSIESIREYSPEIEFENVLAISRSFPP
jgi:phosphoglycolate phosphatase